MKTDATGNKGSFDPKKASIILGAGGIAAGLASVKAEAEKIKPKQIKESVAPSQAKGFTVTDPNGHIHTFPNEQSASRFKMAAGIQ